MTDHTGLENTHKKFTWAWLRDRLFPRGPHMLILASYIIIISVLVLYVLDPTVNHTSERFYATVTLLTILLVLNILWADLPAMFPNRTTGNYVLLSASFILILLTAWFGNQGYDIYLVFMLVTQTHGMLPFKQATAFTVVLVGSWMGIAYLMGMSPDSLTSLWIGLVIGLAFIITLTQVLRRYSEQTERANELLRQLQTTHAELVAARQREKDLAVAEERVRVARDLHDGLGHHLTALSIQLQAVEKLIKTAPDQAAEAAHNARSEVQAALKEVRQSVGVLRQAPLDLDNLAGAIAALVTESAQRSGIQASFIETGPTLHLAPAVAMTLFRTAQEGLTNIQRHARGVTQVWVRLERHTGTICLCVQDDGQETPDAPALGGFGLAGLNERAVLLGGQFSSGRRPEGGFELVMTLPVETGDANAQQERIND